MMKLTSEKVRVALNDKSDKINQVLKDHRVRATVWWNPQGYYEGFHSGIGPSRSDPKNRHWNKLKKALETISMEPEDLSGDFGKGHFSIPA